MEKEEKKRNLNETRKNVRKHYESVGVYFEDENATAFEVVLTSVLLIVGACNENLIVPPETFGQELIHFINLHTQKNNEL